MHRKLTAEWTYKGESDAILDTEQTFVGMFLTTRARAYSRAVIARLQVECLTHTLPAGKCAYADMFLQPAVQQCVNCLNHTINLHE